MSVTIIAEAGVNHNGSVETAKRLIDAAQQSGADYVKFQTFSAAAVAHHKAQKAEYQIRQVGAEENQFEMLKKLELSFDQFAELKSYCIDKNIGFLSTAFDLESLECVLELGVDYLKVPSGEVTNYPLLRGIGAANKPTLISTGMCFYEEVEAAVDQLVLGGLDRQQLKVFHCNTEYPTPFGDVNLRAMSSMGERLNLPFGYSDHTLGITVPIAAVALGATVIEKHFTLDKKTKGPDHLTSLEPHELKAMVQGIRDVEASLGTTEKAPSPSEMKNRSVARRGIYAKTDIAKGEALTEKNLILLRPAEGLTGDKWFEVQGSPSDQAYQKGDPLSEGEVKL